MINELLKNTYKSLSLYISDDSQTLRQVSQEFIADLLQSMEMSFNVLSGLQLVVYCVLTVNHALIKDTIGKEPDRLTDKNIFRIILVDHQDVKIDRTFVCTEAVRQGQGDRSGDVYNLLLTDIYGFYLYQTAPSNLAVSYKGTPLSVMEQLIDDAFKLPDEILRSYNIPVMELKVSSNTFSFLEEPKEITFKCNRNMTPADYISLMCRKYNLYAYHDLQSFCVVENLDIHNLPVKTASDGSPLFSETARTDYEFKICDKIKQPKAPVTLENIKLTISKNSGGKAQTTETLDFDKFIRTIELNNNADELLGIMETREITESSGNEGVSAILHKYTEKYLTNNTLIIYCSCTLLDCNPGTVTSVELRPISGYTSEMHQKDQRYSGNWFIMSSTFKVIGQKFIVRLILCRFDNSKDTSTLSEVASDASSDTSFASSKPQKPKKSRLTSNKAVTVLEELSETMKTASGSFLSKISTVNSQMQKYTQYADQKISALTAPIKTQFVNQVQNSEIAQKAQSVMQKNRRTIGIVNNILKQKTGVDLSTAVSVTGEIMNIDAVVKDAVLSQVDNVYNSISSGITNVVSSASSLVTTTVANAAEVAASLDETTTNAENLDLNLDQALDTVEKAYNAVQTTKSQIDQVKNSVSNLKETVKNIPNTVKIDNPLKTLKAKREQLLNSVRVKR